MALERKLISFAGGMRPVPDEKPLDCPDEIINYEQLEKGILEKRRDPITFEASFDTAVKTAFNVPATGHIIDYAPEPFYPANLPSDITDGYDYFIPVYGYNGTEYKLYLFYKATRDGTDAWVYQTADTPAVDLLQGIIDDGVVFTKDSKLRFSYDKDLLYITDNVNNLFFITTNKEGNVVSAKCGIPPSKSKPIITAMDDWDDSYFEEDNIGDSLGEIGLIRVIYTCSTKEGYKNNPSPASDFADFQWIKLDDGSQSRWLKKFQVTNVKVPDNVNDYIKDELKYFDFYFEIFRYSEGIDTKTFEFSCRREIFDKDGANSYTIAIPASATILADWENDVAPVAKDLVAFDGKVVLAQVKDKLKFPFEFDNIWKIKLNNQDNKTRVDGVVRIRLYDKDAIPDPSNGVYPIENFSVVYYCNGTSILNTSKIRIYDSDLTTPIMVDYFSGMSKTEGDNKYIDLFIKIPQLQASSIHTLYLCFGGDGVPNEYNDIGSTGFGLVGNKGIRYGRFYSSEWTWSMQQVFQPRKVTNENCLVCSPMDERDWADSDKVPNKANTEVNGTLSNAIWIEDGKIAKLYFCNELIGKDSVQITSESGYVKYGSESQLFLDSIPPKTCSIYGNLFYNSVGPGSGDDYNLWNFVSDDVSPGHFFKLCAHNSYVGLHIWSGAGTWSVQFTNVNFDNNAGEDDIFYFIFCSYSISSQKAYLFLLNLNDGTFQQEEKDISDGFCSAFNNLSIKYLYFGASPEDNTSAFPNIIYDQWLVDGGNYINDPNTALNIANFMPAFDNMIGYKYSDDSHNNNITFEKVDNSLKAKNILRWSKKGGFAFPDTYYKSGIPSPISRIVLSLSTLALQSQNVIKIYLRNGLYKFIAEGDPSTWANLSNNLIQQNKRFGLLQQDALAETPYGEFHLSEAGIIQWLGDALKIVTNIRTEEGEHKIIDIPLDKEYIMFYCPLRRQLFIQEKFEERFLVTEEGKFITTESGKRILLTL